MLLLLLRFESARHVRSFSVRIARSAQTIKRQVYPLHLTSDKSALVACRCPGDITRLEMGVHIVCQPPGTLVKHRTYFK